ncbi:MAG: MFS transporter [Bacteroidota bacterium]
MPILYYFFLLFALFFINSLVNIVLLWHLVLGNPHTTAVGMVFCLSAILPYLLQKRSASFTKWMTTFPYKGLCLAELCIGIVLANAALGLEVFTSWWLYGVTVVFNVVYAIILHLIETTTATKVLQKKIEGHHAARFMQFAGQAGMILGAILAGFLLEYVSLKHIMLIGALTAGLVVIVVFPYRKTKLTQEEDDFMQSKAFGKVQTSLQKRLCILLFLLALSLQVQSFNFLFPILLSHERKWGPMVLGTVDACSGLGSILGLFFSITLKKYVWYFCLITIGFFDAIVSLSSTFFPIAGGAFLVAFCFTLVRVEYQNRLYASYADAQEAAVWSGHLAYNTVLLQGLAPLVLGYMVEKGITATHLFLGLGGFLPLLTMSLHSLCSPNPKVKQPISTSSKIEPI